ncbi:hypothetical protein IOK49_02040 [Fervidicoccus fontis]|uniref:Carbohydrate kinase PfkB domain-containing protein n=1 Tax=Fervidicoccus fontis TaxID=683846 RepID=A0A843A7T0_9CREN|nr:PfkB family carbohydrate kinase [Fervidicoccus fontis]MBE9390863.1 hypothetical protein [Fervidicoccus fontis]
MKSFLKSGSSGKFGVHVSVGNLNIDIISSVPELPAEDDSVKAKSLFIGAGGGALNYSVAASRFGHTSYLIGITTPIFSSLGFFRYLIENGVKIDNVKIVEEGSPGVSNIIHLPNEQRRIISYRGVNNLLDDDYIARSIEKINSVDVVHFSSVKSSVALGAIKKIKEKRFLKSPIFSLDPGTESREYEKVIGEFTGLVDVLFLNEKFARNVWGYGFADFLYDMSWKTIVALKLGERGAEAFYEGKRTSRILKKVEYVDTTGAGDAFDAVFNCALIETRSVEESLELAVTAGALKSRNIGASSSPFRSEVFEKKREILLL